MAPITMAEVAKHTTKTDCWVVVAGEVLDVTSFLSQHPGGELAILTFASKDATEEFNMIHPPDVIPKYAPDAAIGKLGAGGGDDKPKKEKKEKKIKSGGGGGGGGGLTMAEVAKHTTKTDCWVVVAGEVLDVTSFLSQHPGGELAILTFAGKDATEEFNMIHPPDVIPKYAPDAAIGKLGAGGGADEKDDSDDDDDSDEDEEEAVGGGGGYSPEEVAKHVTKDDCWVILGGKVLDVTSFLSQHPGGELAILTFAGKDATAEFDMIHPPDVVGKYAPDAVIGDVGSGGGAKKKKEKAPKKGGKPVILDKGGKIANHQA
ncbi:unnamed protein product [Prorocentrum cordatum]|uniref:Cytochrome b5 heme-binding domain-containing protein n=1 Tax=Prorocentrum cordatum TaxID=2364126 RepID=A0ABN9TRM8_9DINO|nr:unnamed protein product [Polarella glacialis]